MRRSIWTPKCPADGFVSYHQWDYRTDKTICSKCGNEADTSRGINTRWIKIYWTLWWSHDRVEFGAPVEFCIHTPWVFFLWRPFSKAQRMNPRTGYAYGWNPIKNEQVGPRLLAHLTAHPQKPAVWAMLEQERLRRSK